VSGGSYLGDVWNRLDFVVVVMGWLPLLIPSLGNLSAIRSLRALRPLRSISILPGVRRQAVTLLDSLPKMGDVMVLFAFCLSLFAVLGTQLFKGSLLCRCYENEALAAANASLASLPLPHPELTSLVSPVDLPEGWTNGVCTQYPSSFAFGLFSGTGNCGGPESGLSCHYYGVNPNAGAVSFDNIWFALMTCFQCVTLEGWVDVM